MTAPITRARLAELSPAEAAALWRIHQDQGLPVESGLFEEWLDADSAHQAAWRAVEQAWSLFDEVDDQEFASLRRAALADHPAKRWYDVREHWRPVAAASAALMVVVAGTVEIGRRPAVNPAQVASKGQAGNVEQVLASSAGSPRLVALADGTKMMLAPDTRARVVLASDRRQVALDRGAITLAVAHDGSRPFRVAALDRAIRDIGTRFEVGVAGGGVRVALYEGSVRVEGGPEATVLKPGEQLVARSGERDVITRIGAAGHGQPELVQFDNTTLATAAETINQGSALKLVLTDPKVAAMRVSGRFRAGDPARFARTVSELLALRVVRISSTRIELHRGR